MAIQRLTTDLYYLFRDGMELRTKHIEDIFGTSILDRAHPNLIVKTKQYTYRGTDLLKQQIPEELDYDLRKFKVESPDIYYIYKSDSKLSASVLNSLPKASNGTDQSTHAILSGVLKVDSRGYYFDPEAVKQLEIEEYLEMINDDEE